MQCCLPLLTQKDLTWQTSTLPIAYAALLYMQCKPHQPFDFTFLILVIVFSSIRSFSLGCPILLRSSLVAAKQHKCTLKCSNDEKKEMQETSTMHERRTVNRKTQESEKIEQVANKVTHSTNSTKQTLHR